MKPARNTKEDQQPEEWSHQSIPEKSQAMAMAKMMVIAMPMSVVIDLPIFLHQDIAHTHRDNVQAMEQSQHNFPTH